MELNRVTQIQYASPVFEKELGKDGGGMAGFTYYLDEERFTNYLRHYSKENRKEVIEELNRLRDMLIQNRLHREKDSYVDIKI